MKLATYKHGQGKPVIILHGLFGFSDNWQTIGRKLADDFTVCLTDLRNHGRSPHNPEFSYEAMANDVVELIANESFHAATIIGHSLGGKVAMTVATEYPELVEKLVVADIAPKYYPPHHDEVLTALHAIDLGSLTSRKEADEEMAQYIRDFGVRQFLLKNLYRTDDNRFAWRMNLDVISRNIEEVGKALDTDASYDGPTLFIRGGRSDYIANDDLDHIREHFPRALVETIPGAGHWVHAEAPQAFLETVYEFLG